MVLKAAEFAESLLAAGNFASPDTVHSLCDFVALVGDDVVRVLAALESPLVWSFMTDTELRCSLLRKIARTIIYEEPR